MAILNKYNRAMEIQLRDLNLNLNKDSMSSFVDDLRAGEGKLVIE